MLQSEHFEFIFECGYSKLVSSVDITCKEEIIKCIWLHYAFFAIHAELQQLRKGIRETLQMELPICMYPNEVHSLLVPSSSLKITTYFFLDEVIIDYSDHGSNKRTFEEAVILHWSDYIIDLPGKCYKLLFCQTSSFFIFQDEISHFKTC